ncbi:hypothetical protein TVA88_18230 [Aeromonas hydrophila]|uniref:hypothetical protein n=1 Tax=Aeromonas hydrophila TaxID=644 RepID=UPI00311DDB62
MNKANMFKNGLKVLLLPIMFFSAASESATIVSVDAQRNCFSNPWESTSGGTAAKFKLAQGRYVLSLVNNSMSCSYGQMDGCKINTLFVQGSFGNSRWGISVTSSPIVVDVPVEGPKDLVAFVSDSYCQDNTGGVSLLIQEAK